MNFKLLLSVLLLLSFSSLFALNLKEAVVETLHSNPKIIEYMQNYEVAKASLEVSDALYYPTLDLKAGYGYQDISNSSTAFEKRSDDIYETSLVLNQNLFDGFRTTHSVSRDEARVMSSSYRFIEKANETAFDTVKTYLDVLRERELQEIAVQNIQINNRIFNKVQALYQTGMTTLSEKEKIESSLSLARSNYFVSKNSYRDSKRAFEKIYGSYVNPDEMQVPRFEVELPLKHDEALSFCFENNPSLRVSLYEVIAAQEDYKEKKSQYYPSIDAEVRQAFNSNLNGIPGDEDDFKAMVVLSYNLFNGGADSAEVQKRQSLINKEVAVQSNLKRQIKEDFDFSWNAIEELYNQNTHLISYKNHSVKTLTLYTDEYEMGKRSLLDLLASQNDLISAKKQIVTAKYKLLFKKYNLLNTMSIMVPSIVGNLAELYARVELSNLDASQVSMGKGMNSSYLKKHQEICKQNLSLTVLKLYGCEKQNEQIRRFSEFVFECKTGILEDSTLKRLDSVIKGLKNDRLENKTITIISHSDDTGNKENDISITKKQNSWMKEHMQANGINISLIKTIAKGSSEPLWLDKSTGLSEQNCRTDIIISNALVN